MDSQQNADGRQQLFEQKLKNLMVPNDHQVKEFLQICEEPTKNNDHFDCPICMCIVVKPLSCGKCDNHLFCSDCVDKLQTKECPYCKQNDFRPANKLLLSMLDNTVLKCVDAQCKAQSREFKYDNARYHLQADSTVTVNCPNNCGLAIQQSMPLEEAYKHFQVCPNEPRKCLICDVVHKGVVPGVQGDPLQCIQHLKAIISQKDEMIKKLNGGQMPEETDKIADELLTASQKQIKDDLVQLFLSDPIVQLDQSMVPIQGFKKLKDQLTLPEVAKNSKNFSVQELDNNKLFRSVDYAYKGWRMPGKYFGQMDAQNRPHGFGRIISLRNTIYQGRFQHGVLNGFGVKLFPQGDYHIGQFKDDELDGYGKVYSMQRGQMCVALWQKGVILQQFM